jgi:Uma2 family endonuclease
VNEDRTMQGAPDRVRMTYDDLLALPDDGLRHELIDGEHIVSPSPGSAHQLIVGNLYLLIRSFLSEQPLGVVMLAPFDIVFSRHDVVEPDLIYFSIERFRSVVGEKNAQGAPDLAVEVVSPWSRRRDEVTKRRLYERWGVAEYWVVDPELESIKVYRLVDGTFQRTGELSVEAGDSITTQLLPGLALTLASVFELP